LKKNIIITGGNGQDGRILSRLIDKNKFKVYSFHNNKIIHKINKVTYIYQNLLLKKNLDFFFEKIKPDFIIHLAAYNPSIKENNDKKFYYVNFKATKNIFLSSIKSNKKVKFIFCSSSQIFKSKKKIVTETSRKEISSAYTKFRIESDKLMLQFKKKYKLKYTAAILFNHDSLFRKKKFLIPRIIKAIKNKNYLFINHIIKSNIWADFSHAEDICNGIYKIINSKTNYDSFILSSGKSTSVNQIILHIIRKYHCKLNISIKRIKKKKTLIGDNNFAKKILNWKHKKNIFIAAEEIYTSK